MNKEVRFVRRNRVDERNAAGIGLLAGIVAVVAGAEPTGSFAVDALLVTLSVTAVAWASASAPWWASAGSVGIAASIALDPIVAGIGAVAFAGALYVGLKRRDLAEWRAVIGGVAANVLIRSELEVFLGLSAIIGIAIGLAVIVVGLRRRPRAIRTRGWITLGSVGGLMILAVIGVALAGLSARPDATAGVDAARSGIASLNRGEYEAAADRFDEAAQSFGAADDRLGGVVALPSRLLPGVAQNVRAGADLADAASVALGEAATALRDVDPASITVSGGQVDLAQVAAVSEPLGRVQAALEQLSDATEQARSPWLVDRLTQELDELEVELDDEAPRLQNAIDAVDLAPQMLGGDGQRRYLVLFTTPAEARGLGGFPGNYAEVVIDNGRLRIEGFDRRSDLEQVIRDNGASCAACPEEFLNSYGGFGFTSGPDGGVDPRAWSNITMPAHFPHVAETAAVLYPQSGGRSIDGVIVMDPYVIAALMEYSGPITLPEFGVTVSADDAADFILREQYVLAGDDANADRIDALDTLGTQVIAQLLTGALPSPPDLISDLAPLVSERRLLLWTNDEAEQDLLERVGLLGSIPELDPVDGGFSVSVTNGSASKIDVFLERDVSVDVVTSETGQRQLVADVQLTNTAPASGLPRYVIGNSVGLDRGSSRLYVTFYGPPDLEQAQLDGEALGTRPLREAGWSAFSTFVDFGPGESRNFRLVFELPPAPADVDEADVVVDPTPTVFEQPLADRS